MKDEKIKLGFWKTYFIVTGIIANIIAILIIAAILAIIIFKPFGIDVISVVKNQTTTPYDHPLLSSSQEKLLQSVGIDPASLPATITPAQQKCATDILGQQRVAEIIAGATPSISEIYKLKVCL